MAKKERVCKNCGHLTELDKCPLCNGTILLDKFKGKALILNVKNSQVAQEIKAEHNAKFALKHG